MKKILPLVLCAVMLSSCSEEKKLLRKASNAVDQSEFERALSYYDLLLNKDQNSYFGNAGKGIVLSEFMGRHEAAIPYLENALKNSPPEKSKPVVTKNLAQSYHFIGNFKRALEYYGTLDNNPDYSDYDEFLQKRIADCKFAMAHPEVALPENQSVDNLGTAVNTDKPEYTPVFTGNKLFFTSKRQDDPKEKKNGMDGKYFESVYVSERTGSGWSQPKKIDLGPTAGMGKKYGEAITSASADGKTLYIYKGGQLFSTTTDDASYKMEKLDKSINFSDLQNHVSVSPDGNTMFLTSEAEGGRGGSDIYFAEKQPDGTWSTPKPLDHTINTPYDEEAPYVNENGVLFFASNGHPGYGGFDIYRSAKVNGQWSKPVNLGQPVNSPGDDIFFSLLPQSSRGYFASARPGGHGDLDIYKVHYVITDLGECTPAQDLLAMTAMPEPTNPMAYNIALTIPEEQKANIRSYSWSVNGKPLTETKESIYHVFEKPATYVVTSKVIAGCDTCPQLLALCAEKTIEVKNDILAATEPDDQVDKSSGKLPKYNNNKKNNKDQASGKNKTSQGSEGLASESSPNTGAGKPAGKNSKAGKSHVLNEEELKALNWNTMAPTFALNDTKVSQESRTVLDHNASVLKSNDELKVTIIGHADSRGSSALNKSLSLQRAKAVQQYLLQKGVTNAQIKAVKGQGEEELVNNCADGVDCSEDEHAQNRRVELEVTGSGTGSITLK